MRIEIVSGPGAAAARVHLDQGEALTAEVGAMIAMSSNMNVETTTAKRGAAGFGSALKRMFAGENFFLNHYTAMREGEEVIVGPKNAGDVVTHTLNDATLVVQGSSWLGSSHGIAIDATWQGLGNALLAGEGMFWIKCSGSGELLLNSFGAIYTVDVEGDYVVDTGHIVAFEDSLSFRVTKSADSWLGSFLGGEGLVCRFSGRGRLYCQTHNPSSFGKALGALLKPREK